MSHEIDYPLKGTMLVVGAGNVHVIHDGQTSFIGINDERCPMTWAIEWEDPLGDLGEIGKAAGLLYPP
jgi:hypothetical protein